MTLAARLEAISARAVSERICARHGVTLADVESRSRLPEVHRARREIASVLHSTLGLGWSELGRLLERDHSTVITMVRNRTQEL